MALTDNLSVDWELTANGDDSVGSNNLTNNGVSFVSGLDSTVGDFEESQFDYLSIADTSAVSLNGTNWTIECWVNFESLYGNQALVEKWDGTQELRGYYLRYNSTSNRFTITVRNSANTTSTTVTANNFGAPSTGAWYQVIARYDGSTLKIRVNNGTDDSVSYSSGVQNTNTPLRVGHGLAGGNPFVDGKMGRVRIWKRALSDTECAQLYSGGNSIPYPLVPVPSFSISPSTIRNLTSGIVLTLTGTDTAWDGTTVFGISGVTGASKVSQNVTSATSATVTIDTGSGAGTLTVTESVTGTATATTTVSNAFTSKADGDWNSSGETTWNEPGVPTEYNTVTISSGHDITVTSDTKCGTGTGTALTLSGTLTVTGAKFTLRGSGVMNSNSVLTVENDGATQGTFEFDANSGVNPTIAMASSTKTIFTGTSYENPVLINTKSGSAGGQGKFTCDAATGVGFDWQYASFARLGTNATDGTGNAYPAVPSATFIGRMRDCYVDMASCGPLPYITIYSGGADFIQLLDNVWGYQGTTSLNAKAWGISIANGISNLTTGTREVIGNVTWGTPVLTGRVDIPFVTDVTFRHNAFLSGFFGSTSTYLEIFEENFAAIGGGQGASVPGDCVNNYIVSDDATQATVLYYIDENTTHDSNIFDGNIFQDVGRTSGTTNLAIAMTGGGVVDRYPVIKRNIVLPSQGTASLRLCDTLHRAEAGFNATTHPTVEHNTVVSNTSIVAMHIFGYDSTTPKLQDTDMVASLKSNIVVGTSGYILQNYSNSAPALTDSALATALGYNCWKDLSLVAAGKWSATSGDTGVEDGTPYDSPMSGSTAPGANDLEDVDPEFVDPTRDLTTWAVTQGSASGTFAGKKDDAYAYVAADPRTKIPSLIAWVKAGFKVRNQLLEDAGHDGVTIGAMEYEAPSSGIDHGARMRRLLRS